MRPRPEVVIGSTYAIETGSGKLFVTINDDDKGIFEVFATIGKSGGYVASFTEAIGRLVSLCLRSGVPPLDIAKQLVGIRGPRFTFWRKRTIHSVPDAIGHAILAHLKQTEEALVTVEEDPASEESGGAIFTDTEEV